MEVLKLYAPATGELDDNGGLSWDDELYDEPFALGSEDLVGFAPSIRNALKREMDFPEATDRGLMEYYGEDDAVDRKVKSMTISAEDVDGRLYGVATCEVNETLTPEELETLKEYFSGQMSDGFGEGFEQRPIETSHGDLYVHLWQSKNYFVRTVQEMEAMRQTKERSQAAKHKHLKGGDAR